MEQTNKTAEINRKNALKQSYSRPNIKDLVVIINDINQVNNDEISEIKIKIAEYNYCIYRSKCSLESKDSLLKFANTLGMKTYDSNNIDSNAVSEITNIKSDTKIEYVPYTTNKLNWHTDGYYNNSSESIFSWLLHCVQPAKYGGENFLLDHEVVFKEYIKRFGSLSDLDRDDAFIIPENKAIGRPDTSSYVFSNKNIYNRIHMKFSMRKNNIEIKNSLKNGYENLRKLITDVSEKYSVVYKLDKNEGILSNNVLHGRNEYKDGKSKRKLFRVRSYERM